jgi:hypothetical protein
MEEKNTSALLQEIQFLREKITLLEASVLRLTEMGNYDRRNMLKYINDRLKEMDVFIWPMFQKLFPNYDKAANSMQDIIKQAPTMQSYGKTKDGKEIL